MKRFLKRLRKRRQLDRDLEEELGFHLGMSGREAFGNPTAIKEEIRTMWTFTTIETLWQDLRYAFRMLAKTPGVTLAAALALALGIGANTTMFTVLHGVFAIDLGINDIERIAVISIEPSRPGGAMPSLPELRELRSGVKSFESLAAYRIASINLSDDRSLPERFWCAQMSASGFDIFDRRALIGRVFKAQDERPDAPPVAVISYKLWQNRYGSDVSAIGRTVDIDNIPRIIIGVMPAGIQVPEGVDLWLPLHLRGGAPQAIFGRLAPGVKVGAARGEIESLIRSVFPADGERRPIANVHLLLDDYGVYASRPLFIAVMAAVFFVLLIACADVANLLLARAAARSREISIRIAIGAGRTRIIRQLLVESILLAILGGFFGWMIAQGGLRWFERATAQMGRPDWIDFTLNARAFLYLAAISIGTGILFGLAPALRLAKVDVNSSIKDGGHGAAQGAHGRRLTNLLVIFEMALCVVLLTGSGLLIRSSVKMYSAPIGARVENVLTAHVGLPVAKYAKPEDEIFFHRQLKARLESLPGVESVAIASAIPGWGFGLVPLAGEIEGKSAPAITDGVFIGTNYFHVIEAEPRRGRSFTDLSKDEAIVNESFIAKFGAGRDLLGKRIRFSTGGQPGPWLPIVGVAPDIRQDSQRPLERFPLVYLPYAQNPRRVMFLLARTSVPPATLGEAFRRETQNLDPNLPLYDVETLEHRVSRQRLNVTAFGALLTIFAGIALVLASVGLYAVVAHAVSQRTQEIGVRMALGGATRDILALVFAQGMRPLAVGIVIGTIAAFGVTRVLRTVLVGVSPGDPLTLLGVILVLAAMGALGCAIPARRAIRVDPLVALRCD